MDFYSLVNDGILILHRERKEMRALVEKFPDGLRENDKPPEGDYYDQSSITEHSGKLELDSEIIAGKFSATAPRTESAES